MVKFGAPEIDGVFSEKMSTSTTVIVSVSTVVLAALMMACLICHCRRKRAKRDQLDDEEAARKKDNEARLAKMQQLDPTLLGLGASESLSTTLQTTKVITAAEATRWGAAEVEATATTKEGELVAVSLPVYTQRDRNKANTTKS